VGIAERRAREREALRTRIVEAAREILSEQGPDALSIRSIAERIEYSPATIYLYFRDKAELIREVAREGFARLVACIEEAVGELGPNAHPADQFRATGRAYARFAVENAAYFRVMFEPPEVPGAGGLSPAEPDPRPAWGAHLVTVVTRGKEAGLMDIGDPVRAALIAWGVMHGLASLYLSGRLAPAVQSPEQFAELTEAALATLWEGWKGQGTGDFEPGRRGGMAAADV